MKETTIICILMIIIIIYYFNNNKDIAYTRSSLNKEFYLVRNLPDKKRAANLIARVVKDLKKLVIRCYKDLKKGLSSDKKMKLYIMRMYDRFDNINFRETSGYSPYTSYTVNKGDEMVLCIRSKKTGIIHNYNIIMYVAIHELAHVGCTEYGHTKLFFQINRYLLRKGIKIGIYKYVNYASNPKKYCGMNVGNNVLS